MSRGSIALAGSAAVLLAAPAFTSTSAPHVVPERTVSSAQTAQTQGSALGGSAMAVGAVTALGLGAVMGRRTARSAVLTKDDAGRFRFDMPVAALVAREQPGITQPLGFFDPLGFSENALLTFSDDPNGFKHLRAAEIKHGRVAMMASVGSFAAHFWQFPTFENVPTGLKALENSQGLAGFCLIMLLVAVKEASDWKPSKDAPGSYGDPFKFGQYTPEMRTKELNNGRMAMFAMMGQLFAETTTGLDPAQQFGF